MRIKRLLAIGLSIGIIASMLLSASGVYAAPIVQVQKPIANLQVSKTANNKSAQTQFLWALRLHLLRLRWYSPIGRVMLGTLN